MFENYNIRQIYCNYLNLIVNIILPLAVMVGMNVCVYSTMRNRWFQNDTGEHEDHPGQTAKAVDPAVASADGKDKEPSTTTSLHGSHQLFSRQSTSYSMRRVGGLNEAEFKKRDAKYTRASVVMVVAFVVCNSPRCIPNIMEIIVGLEACPPVSSTLND